jgi:hypothetical protein
MTDLSQGTRLQHSQDVATELAARSLHSPPRPAGIVQIHPPSSGTTARAAYDFGVAGCSDAYKITVSTFGANGVGSIQWLYLTDDDPSTFTVAAIAAGTVPVTGIGFIFMFGYASHGTTYDIPAGLSFRYVVLVESGGASENADLLTTVYRHTSTASAIVSAASVADPEE